MIRQGNTKVLEFRDKATSFDLCLSVTNNRLEFAPFSKMFAWLQIIDNENIQSLRVKISTADSAYQRTGQICEFDGHSGSTWILS